MQGNGWQGISTGGNMSTMEGGRSGKNEKKVVGRGVTAAAGEGREVVG